AQTNFAQESNSRRARIELPDSTKPGAGDVPPLKLFQRNKPAGKPAAARIARSETQRSCGRTVAQDCVEASVWRAPASRRGSTRQAGAPAPRNCSRRARVFG